MSEESDTADDRPEKNESKAAGGYARAEALAPEERGAIARNAALARWGAPKATHEGSLRIGDIEIESAVLEDGTRVLSRAGFIRAIGRKGKAKGGRKYDLESSIPVFLTAANLKPFVSKNLVSDSTPIAYRTLKGVRAMGYKADLLPQVCGVFINAKYKNALLQNQEHIAERCRILSQGFAVVGITALVDEATGYQEVRDRLALQAILDSFLRKEFAAWAKRFPDEFYQQIFRLRRWEWSGMKKGRRPQVVANYTNDLVYQRLAPGILRELETRNPPDEKGRRKVRHHQYLTEDVGHPALAQHLYGVIGLMRVADNWEAFKKMIDRAFPRRGDTLQLDLFQDRPSNSDASTAPQQPS